MAPPTLYLPLSEIYQMSYVTTSIDRATKESIARERYLAIAWNTVTSARKLETAITRTCRRIERIWIGRGQPKSIRLAGQMKAGRLRLPKPRISALTGSGGRTNKEGKPRSVTRKDSSPRC